jgi:hypothetical protein
MAEANAAHGHNPVTASVKIILRFCFDNRKKQASMRRASPSTRSLYFPI